MAMDSLATAKLRFSTVSADWDTLRAKLEVEKEQVKTRFVNMKKSMCELGENYGSLRASFGELKKAYEASQALVVDLREVRAWAAEGLQTIEPLLNDDSQYARAASIKVLVAVKHLILV